MSLLRLQDVSLDRGQDAGYELLIRNLNVRPCEYVAITGPSGCGKSTTLDMAGMILRPDSARVFELNLPEGVVDIRALWQMGRIADLTQIRRFNLGYVLQTGELFSFLNVRENIELAAVVAGVPRKEAAWRAAELMEKLEITRLAKEMPAHLSIGERQRTAIGRAMCPRPRLLLADEPTAALDPALSEKVMRLFMATVADYGASVLMVTHDTDLAARLGFRNAPIKMHQRQNGVVAVLDDA